MTSYDIFSQFDRLLHGRTSYDPKLHRDDRARANSKGSQVNNEERQRKVPSLSSSHYGYRPPLETPSTDFRRVSVVNTEFFNSNRIGGQQDQQLIN